MSDIKLSLPTGHVIKWEKYYPPKIELDFITGPFEDTQEVQEETNLNNFLNERANDNAYNLWVGHTNFNVSRNILDLVKSIPGVEAINVLSRYRVRIGIGKVFIPRQVLSTISTEIKKYLKKNVRPT